MKGTIRSMNDGIEDSSKPATIENKKPLNASKDAERHAPREFSLDSNES